MMVTLGVLKFISAFSALPAYRLLGLPVSATMWVLGCRVRSCGVGLRPCGYLLFYTVLIRILGLGSFVTTVLPTRLICWPAVVSMGADVAHGVLMWLPSRVSVLWAVRLVWRELSVLVNVGLVRWRMCFSLVKLTGNGLWFVTMGVRMWDRKNYGFPYGLLENSGSLLLAMMGGSRVGLLITLMWMFLNGRWSCCVFRRNWLR